MHQPTSLHLPISAAPGGVSRPASISNEPTSELDIVAPGTLSPSIHRLDSDTQMGAQLTEQYHRATGGIIEVVKFGAMIMALRERFSILAPHAEPKHQGRGRYPSDTGLKAWLTEHAPTIKEATAYRLLHVSESVMQDFQLPAKVSFIELATTAAEALPEKLRHKQEELWDFVNGTSQRSWLDRFCPAKEKGGYRATKKDGSPRNPKRTNNQIKIDLLRMDGPDLCARADSIIRDTLALSGPQGERSWDSLEDAALDELKLKVYDLYQGILETQKRRALLRKKGSIRID